MYFHSKFESVTLPFTTINIPAPVASTYLVASAMIRRVLRPLELQVSGSTEDDLSFNFGAVQSAAGSILRRLID